MTNEQLEGFIQMTQVLSNNFEIFNFCDYEMLTQQLAEQVWRMLEDARSAMVILRHFGDLEDDYEESLN